MYAHLYSSHSSQFFFLINTHSHSFLSVIICRKTATLFPNSYLRKLFSIGRESAQVGLAPLDREQEFVRISNAYQRYLTPLSRKLTISRDKGHNRDAASQRKQESKRKKKKEEIALFSVGSRSCASL